MSSPFEGVRQPAELSRRRPPPRERTAEVHAEHGFDDKEIGALTAEGAVS